MTKNETLMVLAMLNAFYGGGKNDPEQQVHAWHLIMGKYDFETVRLAVLHFAENDTREYATFPAVGLIVNEVRKMDKARNDVVNEIIYGVSYGREYAMLSANAKTIINEKLYNEWLSMDAEVFNAKAGTYKQLLKNERLKLQ